MRSCCRIQSTWGWALLTQDVSKLAPEHREKVKRFQEAFALAWARENQKPTPRPIFDFIHEQYHVRDIEKAIANDDYDLALSMIYSPRDGGPSLH